MTISIIMITISMSTCLGRRREGGPGTGDAYWVLMRTKIATPTPTPEPPVWNMSRAPSGCFICTAPENMSYRGRDSGGGWGHSGSQLTKSLTSDNSLSKCFLKCMMSDDSLIIGYSKGHLPMATNQLPRLRKPIALQACPPPSLSPSPPSLPVRPIPLLTLWISESLTPA